MPDSSRPCELQHTRPTCSYTISQSLLELMSIESMMPSNHLILCRPLLFLSSTFPGTRVFYNELVLSIRWPMYWGFSLTISHFNANSGLISYRADRFDLHAVQGTLKSFLQHHSSKPTILWCSAFFRVQLSHPYLTTGKPIALTIWTFVGKVMSLFLNMLFRFVTAFLPRSKHLLISRLQSPASVTFGAQENKVCHCFYFSPSICHKVIGLNAMIFIFWMLSLKPAFLPSSFTFINRLFNPSSLSAIRVAWSYLKLLIFLPAILIPASASSSTAFHMIYSAYNLNMQGDNIQPWHTPFSIWNQSIVPSLVQTVASWPAYRFLRRQETWSSTPILLWVFRRLLRSTKGQKKQ